MLISFALVNPVKIRPLFISKLNTAVQIGFAGLVLASKAFHIAGGIWFPACIALVAALTLASAAAYLVQWLKHMAS